MSQMKRLLNSNQSIHHETKKSRITTNEEKSVTCIEDLSNELLYEIFDYLDGCEIFDAFSNLNTYFHEFLNSSSFLLKIYRFSTRERTFKRYCKQVIIPNKHKIISLCLYDQALINLFFTQCTIDFSFNHLESFVLNGIKFDQLLPLLIDVMYLPHLVSLNICLIGDFEDPEQLYIAIFNLPFLKYVKIAIAIYKEIDLLPIDNSMQISTIEQLNINHECTLDELQKILSYTRQLRRLTCRKLFRSNNTFSHTLSNMTYISINECYLNFDEFELFIKQIGSKLQMLRMINQSSDKSYLDADRWEQLISQYIPHLHKFDFQFYENYSFPDGFTSYHARINRFKSSFWTERRWILELEIVSLGDDIVEMKYSIHSYRKQWFDFHQTEQVTDWSQTTQLTVTRSDCHQNRPISINTISSVFSWIEITHLDIDCTRVPIVIVIEIIRRLPNINSLRVFPMAAKEIRSLTGSEIENLSLDSRNCKLTKMKLRLTTEIEQVHFFIGLNQFIEYLTVECSNDINPEMLAQYILLKTPSCFTLQLRSLCLGVGQVNDQTINKLHQIMARRGSYYSYTIKRLCDKIYLQWK